MKTCKYLRADLAALSFLVLPMVSCNQQARDQEIKADITVKAKEDVNFAGVQFTVENGRVTLLGSCPTLKSRAMLRQKLKTIHVIDSVDDRLQIAPVTIGSSFAVKQQVDSVLASYPTVTATVSDNAVALLGSISKKELGKLLESVGKVYANPATDRLTTNP
jgi:osmotically-inducible protein OsmY